MQNISNLDEIVKTESCFQLFENLKNQISDYDELVMYLKSGNDKFTAYMKHSLHTKRQFLFFNHELISADDLTNEISNYEVDFLSLSRERYEGILTKSKKERIEIERNVSIYVARHILEGFRRPGLNYENIS